MDILYFGALRDALGRDGETVIVPEEVTTLGALVDWLATRSARDQAAFADRSRVRAAIDQRFAPWNAALNEAREVALFPPVTGG